MTNTRRHITVSEFDALLPELRRVLDDPRIDRVKLKLARKVAGISDEDEQAMIRDGAPCFLSIVVRADPMQSDEIYRIERGIDWLAADLGRSHPALTAASSLCRALHQARAMLDMATCFKSVHGARKWVAYRLRTVMVEGRPLPSVLKYSVSLRTTRGHGDLHDDEEAGEDRE